jgi:hypothetical protein
MRRPPAIQPLLLLAAPLLVGACRGSDAAGRPRAATEGRLVLTWRGGAELMDAPGRATYCAGDSMLTIFAVDRRWGAGLVLHGRFPVDSTRAFAVRPTLGDAGTATAAFRSVSDSVQRAVMALRGTVWLEPGGRATGHFEIGAAPLPRRSDPVHLVGAFRSLPTADSSTTCSAWSRTP